MTDADILSRLTEADPRLGSVVAEARELFTHDADIVEIFAMTLADVLSRRFGAPPRSILAHIAEHEKRD